MSENENEKELEKLSVSENGYEVKANVKQNGHDDDPLPLRLASVNVLEPGKLSVYGDDGSHGHGFRVPFWPIGCEWCHH